MLSQINNLQKQVLQYLMHEYCIVSLIASAANKDKEEDGYMFTLEKGLKYVPGKNKTQCIIEVLQVIKKYEIRE